MFVVIELSQATCIDTPLLYVSACWLVVRVRRNSDLGSSADKPLSLTGMPLAVAARGREQLLPHAEEGDLEGPRGG